MNIDRKIQLEIESEWNHARRKAIWTQLRAALTRYEGALIDFDQVSRRLGLKNVRYLGLQNIRLEQIVGSVGRYKDFLDGFLPRSPNKDMRTRWEGIARLYLEEQGPGIPPIEVYKVGESYFVKDGNHRVSVAIELGLPDIEAYVWEYILEIDELPAPDGSTIDALLLAAERQDFLHQTRLPEVLPEAEIRVTVPGAYLELLQGICAYEHVLETIDETDYSFPQAAEGWYTLRYEPVLGVIQASGVMDHFPERTAADMFVFITRCHAELEARYERNVLISDAILAYEEGQRGWWRRLGRRLMGLLRGRHKGAEDG